MTAKPDLDQPMSRHCHPDTDRMVAEFEQRQAEEETQAQCHECQRTFTLPEICRCPFEGCGSRQIGPASLQQDTVAKLRKLAVDLRFQADNAEYRSEEERWNMRAKGVEDAIELLTGKRKA